MENEDVAEVWFWFWGILLHEFGQFLKGFVLAAKVGYAINVATIRFSPACATVAWEVMD